MITAESSAKINWFLYVLRKRSDGFHEIRSAMQKISLFDSLTFELSDGVRIEGSHDIPDNIILQVIDVVKRYRNVGKRGVVVTLHKRIPFSAGLGGGSSNAAASIDALNRLWELAFTAEERMEMAAEVGSDVPFFLDGSFSIVEGRGEILRPFTPAGPFDLLLVNPGIEVSSAWAYRNTTRHVELEDENRAYRQFLDALNKRDFPLLKGMMQNSLEEAVFNRFPVIREIKKDMVRKGAMISLMSGSGSTVYGIFEDRNSAIAAQKYFGNLWTRVVRTLV
jgi:4-diphosphocytidyl-2-C-methyl-D-erythritol kinase